jgi:hypothetical protein
MYIYMHDIVYTYEPAHFTHIQELGPGSYLMDMLDNHDFSMFGCAICKERDLIAPPYMYMHIGKIGRWICKWICKL